MDKLNLFKLGKENNTNTKNKHIINKLYKKETHTPNKIPPIKTRTHIKIKSRDLNPALNLNTENNITYNNLNRQLRPNRTLNNLNTLKINRDKKLKINLINRHHLNFSLKNNDTYKKILNLWKDLGVNYIYQSVFNKMIKNSNEKERDDYFKYEFDKLNNINNIIKLIKNDIKNRENIIFQLQSNYNNKNIQNKNFNEETLKQIISIFNDIRKYSLDITYNILLLKKELGFDLSLNKYDTNKIFSFKKDYIIKINSDLDFLIDSSLNQYFTFEKSDPFFQKIKFNINYAYNFPEINDEKKIFILTNFKNIFLDELIGQNLNLTNGHNPNVESILNFKHFNFLKINNQNNIIKAQRGLSKQKLRPKINNNNNNKIYIDSNKSNISKADTEIITAKNIQNIKKKVFNTNINLNFNSKIKNDNMPQFDEDMKIFEKIIEQKIFGKQKKLETDNDSKKNKSYNKINKIGTEKKKEFSNFIQNIFNETEIDLSEKTNPKKILTNDINNDNNTEIIKETIIRKAYNEFIIELYNNKLSELENIYKNYYKLIPEKIKYGFNIQSDIKKYINGIYPKFLIVKSNQIDNKIIGIITLNYISANTNTISIGKTKSNNYNKILNISSISCLDETQFEIILLNVIDFCQEFFYYENIILELYYYNKEGEFILYSDLESIIKSKAKFRWVNMENDGINRKIKYKLVNKNKISSVKNINNIINLKSVNLIAYEEENNFKKRDIRELSFINDFSINYLFLEMKGQHNFKITDNKNKGENYINYLINKVTFKAINHICSDFIISQIGANNEIEKFIEENKNVFDVSDFLDKINEKIYYEPYFSLSILNINNSFKNIVKKKFNGFIYNILFLAQISEFSIKDKNDNELIFYLIKNPEYNSSIIIYQLNEEQTFGDIINIFSKNNDNINNNKKNISEIFKDIFSLVNQKPMKINKNIYIPTFKCQANQMCFRPSVFSDVILENDNLNKKYKIDCINFIEELTFGIDEPNNMKENIMDLDTFENKDDIVIKNDFIINFVENNLIFELQIPTIATFFVEKKNWIKSD